MCKRKRLLFILIFITCCILINACAKKEALKIVFVSGSNEYFSGISLVKYKEYLEDNYEGIRVTLLQAGGELNRRDEYSDIQGLEALDDCDVALFYTRRVTIDGEQLEAVKRYVNSGNPIVALRTTRHGFQNWLEFDKLVLGGNYHGHYQGSPERTAIDSDGKRHPEGQPKGPTLQLKINPEAKNHPVLRDIVNFSSRYSLYKTSPLASDVKVLMTGTIPGDISGPVVWTRMYKDARVFYTSLGGLQDFENYTFKRLLANALFWAAKREPRRKEL